MSLVLKPRDMANLDKALDSKAHRPRQLPSENIQTLNVKDTKGKARISRTRISHGAIDLDSHTPSRLLNAGKAEENDQFIFDQGKNDGGRLLLQDLGDDNSISANQNGKSGKLEKFNSPPKVKSTLNQTTPLLA